MVFGKGQVCQARTELENSVKALEENPTSVPLQTAILKNRRKLKDLIKREESETNLKSLQDFG